MISQKEQCEKIKGRNAINKTEGNLVEVSIPKRFFDIRYKNQGHTFLGKKIEKAMSHTSTV